MDGKNTSDLSGSFEQAVTKQKKHVKTPELIQALFDNNSYKFDHFLELIANENTDVNAQDEFGMSALHHAGAMGFTTAIRALVNCGRCDYLIRSYKFEETPASLAHQWTGNFAIIRLLEKKERQQIQKEAALAQAAASSGWPETSFKNKLNLK